MLLRILQEFRECGGLINIGELSRKLGIERSILDGMLDTLVRQGKLNEINTEVSCNEHCGKSCHGCCYSRIVPAGKTYSLNTGKQSE
jgi:hypothetical protein